MLKMPIRHPCSSFMHKYSYAIFPFTVPIICDTSHHDMDSRCLSHSHLCYSPVSSPALVYRRWHRAIAPPSVARPHSAYSARKSPFRAHLCSGLESPGAFLVEGRLWFRFEDYHGRNGEAYFLWRRWSIQLIEDYSNKGWGDLLHALWTTSPIAIMEV